MALTPKMKGVLVIVIFIAIMVGPVCYVLIRDRFFSHTEVKTAAPAAMPVSR